MTKSKSAYQNIAENISASKWSFGKRFAIIGGGILLLGTFLVAVNELSPKDSENVSRMIEIGIYIVGFGIVLAMGNLMNRSLKKKK